MMKIVFKQSGGVHEVLGHQMTVMKNPPIVRVRPGHTCSGGRKYLTYYDGRNLQRLAFREGWGVRTGCRTL